MALWAGVALAVGLASAAQTTIGFDDLADATVVTDQYADRGVVFGTRGARDRVEVRSDDSAARSAPNVASFGNCAVVMDVVRCTNRATGHLSTPATAVSLYVGSIDPEAGGDSRDVVLEGFAADGSSIARDVVRVQPAAPFTHPLTVAAPAGSTIARFEIHLATLETTNARLGFDDLTITTADISTAPPTTTTPATTPPATTTPATTPRPPASALRIGGPQRLALNAPARFVALEAPTTARVHEWDLDGDGSYERNTAAHPAVDHGFTQAGRVVVGLRTMHHDGRRLAATLAVDVDRPPVVGLAFSPAYPKAGDSVSFNVQQRTESGRRFSLFAWNFFGLKPRDEDVRVRPTAGSGPRRGARAGADAATVKLDGAQPTTRPNLMRRLTKKGPQKIELAAITTDGDRTRLHTSIGMGGTANAKVPPVVDCDKDTTYSGPCAGIAVSEPAAVGIKTFFTAALPEVEACLPSNFKVTSAPDRALKHVKAKVDLPYPSPEAFGAGGIQQGIAATRARSASHRGSPRGGSPRARAAQVQYECITGRSSVLQWDLGGGTKIPATLGGAAGSALGTVSKTYAAAGKVTVSLMARVAYLEPCAPNCAGKGSANIAEKFLHVKHFVARKTVVIDVITPVCGVQKLNSIPISTVVAGGGTDARGAAGCFIPTTSLDKKQKLLKPFPGYGVDLNTVHVASGGEILIDPKSGQIFVPPESNWPLTVTPPIAISPYGGQLTMSGGRVLNVPPPTIDPGLKRRVTKLVLPSPQLLGELGGLPVREYDLLLSPDSAAYHRLYLGLPKPLGGGDPPVVLGGSQQTVGAASTAAEDLDTDFELNLADKDLGFLHLKTFMLKHRRSGGWLGGGRLQIPSLNDLEVIADYKRPQPSDKCLIPGQEPPNDVPGPSGISLTASGGFEFGGFALKPGPGTFVIGPVEVTCIGVRGQADPLVLQGLATLEVPAGAPTIYVDGCLGLASLDEDEDASVCGSSIEKKHPKLVWFRASAAIDLLRKLPLADAYFDLRRGGGTTRIGFGANVNVDVFDLGLVRLKGGIAGQIVVQPKFAFEVFGQVGICGSIVDFVNAAGKIVGASPPDCYVGQAIISSKGGAACIKDFVGGYIYWKPEIKIVTGCDLEQDDSLRISAASAQLRDAPAAMGPLGGAMSQRVRVPHGVQKVAFDIRPAGTAPPVVEINGPGGRRILDTGTMRGAGHSIAHVPDGRIFVHVREPAAGTWTITSRPGSGAIGAVGVDLPVAEPQVFASVKRRGASRRLVYRATLAKSDRVRFIEEGATISRQLGRARDGAGTMSFPGLVDSPGRRRVIAAIERNGLPYKQFTVAQYTMPRPKPLRRVAGLRARVLRDRLLLTWRPVRAAVEYEVSAKIGGRSIVLDTRRPRLIIPDASRFDAIALKVVPIAKGDRRGPGRSARLKAARRPRSKLVV